MWVDGKSVQPSEEEYKDCANCPSNQFYLANTAKIMDEQESCSIHNKPSVSAEENEPYKHRERLKLLEKHLENSFYETGCWHNAISDAMEEYAVQKAPTREMDEIEIRSLLQKEYDRENMDTNYNFLTRFAKVIADELMKGGE
jgi:hypothetical protein